jgi:hypothetical protein
MPNQKVDTYASKPRRFALRLTCAGHFGRWGLRMKTNFILASVFLVSMAWAAAETYKSCMEYIEGTQRLWGIESVRLQNDGRVTLVDAKAQGYGYGLTLYATERERVDQVTLGKGEACFLSDGHHAFLTYRYDGLNTHSQLVFTVTDRFDARSFGDDIKEETKTLSILSYKQETESPTKGSLRTGDPRGGSPAGQP